MHESQAFREDPPRFPWSLRPCSQAPRHEGPLMHCSDFSQQDRQTPRIEQSMHLKPKPVYQASDAYGVVDIDGIVSKESPASAYRLDLLVKALSRHAAMPDACRRICHLTGMRSTFYVYILGSSIIARRLSDEGHSVFAFR